MASQVDLDKSRDAVVFVDSRTLRWLGQSEEYISGYVNLIWKPYTDSDFDCSSYKFQYTSLEKEGEGYCIYKI